MLKVKGPTAIVDYALTPDALENVLSTINSIKKNAKLFTVVGCGGRDAKASHCNRCCRYSTYPYF